jgi:hypothetical protein
MGALRAFVGGLLGLVIGGVGAALISGLIMEMAGVSNFEGGLGMAAVFAFGPLGAIAGLILGIWLGLRIGRKRVTSPDGKSAPRHGLRNAAIAIAGIIALGALILWVQYASTPQHLEYDQAGANLEFELRAPAHLAASLDAKVIDVSLDTDLNQMPASWSDTPPRIEGAWTSLSGEVELYYRTANRLLVFKFPEGRDLIFKPALAAKPDPADGWSDWRKVDYVGLPDQPQAVKSRPEDAYELRYRVRVSGAE